MIARFSRTAVRSTLKRPGFAAINIFGLGLGLACFTLIMLFVTDELSYDAFHKDSDRIFRVAFTGYPPNSEPDHFAIASSTAGRHIRTDFPDVESLVRLQPFDPTVLQNGEYFFDDRFFYAEPELLDVFTLPFLYGSPEGQLERPQTMIMTESMAQKYFGEANPVGESMTLNDSVRVEITGVIRDIPLNSHFRSEFFVSYATYSAQVPENEGWLNLGQYIYLKLGPNVDPVAFADRIRGLAHEKIGDELDQFGFKIDLELEPLTEIYLTSKRTAQIGPTGDMTQIWVFSAIAVFVLLLATINFTNLSTARSFERAREVGVRKSLGSSRSELMAQFLGESLAMAFVSLVTGWLLAGASLSVLNDIAGKDIPYEALLRPQLLLVTVSAAWVSGLLGGIYPAFVLSSFRAVNVLKGVFHASKSGAFVRKALVSVQFAVSIALISGTVIVMQQLHFLKGQDLGFDPEQVLVIDGQTLTRSAVGERYESILSSFKSMAGVQDASFSRTIPGRGVGRVLVQAEGLAEDDVRSLAQVGVGYGFFENLAIPMVAGRSYSADFAADDERGVIINEEAVRYFGWSSPQEALGKSVGLGGGRRVIGVVSDYHHGSLKEAVRPTRYDLDLNATSYLALRISGSDASQAVEEARTLWASIFPGFPFESFFLDDDFNRQYQAEERLMSVFKIFSVLAILIACLGLFGLAAFTAAQRTKEIGVRKVLGASVFSIIRLLSKEFVVLVLFGLVLAVPATIYGMNRWLEPFPYRVDVAWWVFGLVGLGALAIALLTVGYQAAKVASADPVTSLRYE
jgi:putative ABC transport system permease protein